MKLSRFFKKTLGTHAQRELAHAETVLERIATRGRALAPQSDTALAELARDLRERARRGTPLEDLLVDTYALVREVAERTIGLRPYDVQVVGGVALHRGRIAEMKTGEGKTLVATLPLVLAALQGRGAHLVTVNDYLAARDAAWMEPIFSFMGLSVGVVTEEMDPESARAARRDAYAADITYVTNHELVFDYLRDNLALTPEEQVLRPLHYAVVDEVDFLLLDEARTPLIISGATGDDPGLAEKARDLVEPLKEETHFRVAWKTRQVLLLDKGWSVLERALGVDNLADAVHLPWQHALHNALLAHGVYRRDEDYIVEDDRVVLVDEFTGRISPDKRLADGLHQALEAKERVEVRSEDQTLAKISYQAFFRLYPRLSGMTGTAHSAREELARTYGLRVVRIPTHRPMIREDYDDEVYKTSGEKFDAVVREIHTLREQGRPILVGTTSVRESEGLSVLLQERDIPHEVLNAKNHHAEAVIIAQAGRPGAVTVSTNMAGRGVDILLGGNPDIQLGSGEPPDESVIEADRERVVQAGGLAVLGTGLHEAQRIDDQLRGRAGRQGDPGSSQYFLSLEDPIYRLFGRSLRFPQVLEGLRARLQDHPTGEPIREGSVRKTLEDLRKKVEAENEGIRREVLQYDLVIEEQRRRIFAWRGLLLGQDPETAAQALDELLAEVGNDLQKRHFQDEAATPERYEDFAEEVAVRFDLDFEAKDLGPERELSPALAADRATAEVQKRYAQVLEKLGRERCTEASRQILLANIDALWTDYLSALERLDEAIGLRGYAELDPLTEFRRESGLLFQELLREIRLEAAAELCALDELFEPEGDELPRDWIPAQARTERRTLKR